MSRGSKTRGQAQKKPQARKPVDAASLLTGTRLYAVLCALLAAATVALYFPVLGHGFLASWDDGNYVILNSHVNRGLAWSTIKWAFTATEQANWHPLTWLSHAFDCQLFALNPAGHHFDNVLIHALNAAGLFLLLTWITRRPGPSLLVAALFAVHPLNVESVAWIAERKNVLSTLFFVAALAGYAWYARKPDWRRYLLVVALFAAGLMAKPMVITLPFVFLLLDYWPLERMQPAASDGTGAVGVSFPRLVAEKIPLLVLSAASAWITLKAQRGQVRSVAESSFAIRAENAIVSYALYLWKTVWPARLGALYPPPAGLLPVWQVSLAALILLAVTVLVVIFRRRRYLPVGWFWFLGTLVPVIGVVQIGEAAMADRYAYVPLIGIFVMIAFGLDDWAQAKSVSMAWRVAPALCVVTILSVVTLRQISYWSSAYSLWSHTLAVEEENPVAHNDVAGALMNRNTGMTPEDLENFATDRQRLEEARQHLDRALALCRELERKNSELYLPDRATTLHNLALLDRMENRTDGARQHFRQALEVYSRLAQRNPDVYLQHVATDLDNLGSEDLRANQPEEARRHYEQAVKVERQLAPQDPIGRYRTYLAGTLVNLGNLDLQQSRLDEAHSHFEEAIEIDRQLIQQSLEPYLPDMAEALNNLGRVDGILNRNDEARRQFESALEVYRKLAEQDADAYLPDVAVTLNNLGFLDRNTNRLESSHARYTEAMSVYRKLAQEDPARYSGDVARVQATLRQLDQASAIAPAGQTK